MSRQSWWPVPPKKILIVDDHADSRIICRDLLGHYGYEVVEAEDGDEALEISLAQLPDLVLLDFLMPRSDGRETLERLRAAAHMDGKAIVLYTAAAVQLAQLEGLEGVDRVLLKPVEAKMLLRVVQDLIGPAIAEPR